MEYSMQQSSVDTSKTGTTQTISNRIFYPLLVLANIGLVFYLLSYVMTVLYFVTDIESPFAGQPEDAFWGLVPTIMITVIFLGLNYLFFSFKKSGKLKMFLFITVGISLIELLFVLS